MLIEKPRPLRQSRIATSPQLSKARHLAHRHPRRPQALEKRDPLEVTGRIPPLPPQPAHDRLDQSQPLVVAKRVRRDAGPPRSLSDWDRLLGICRDRHGVTVTLRARSKSTPDRFPSATAHRTPQARMRAYFRPASPTLRIHCRQPSGDQQNVEPASVVASATSVPSGRTTSSASTSSRTAERSPLAAPVHAARGEQRSGGRDQRVQRDTES